MNIYKFILCLSIIALLAGCDSSDDNKVVCNVDDKISCGTSTVELCDEPSGAVFWLVSDSHEFRCGADSSGCTQSLFSHCNPHSSTLTSQSEPNSLGIQLGAALIEERKKRVALEKTVNQLIIESMNQSGQ